MFLETKKEGEAGTKTTLEILSRAREIIAQPENWIGGIGLGNLPYAKTREGYTCGPCSNGAYSFCLVGAIRRANDNNWHEEAQDALYKACGEVAEAFNDAVGRTHAEILVALDRAIALSKAE